jgi:hypothetical protein
MGTWANIDGPFSYADFYWRIVGLFEDEEEAAALIKFYNQYVIFNLLRSILLTVFILCSHVFGTASDLDGGSQTPAADDVEDEFETIRRQRSAKRARIAQRSGSLEV